LVLALALLIVSCNVLVFTRLREYGKNHPFRIEPGSRELSDASALLTTPLHGVGHGNTPEAQQIAAALSDRLQVIHQTAFVRKRLGSADAEPITKGEFVVYCRMNEDTCAFLIHVPGSFRFTPDAKQAMAEASYTLAAAMIAPHYGDRLKRLAVATKGVLIFDKVLIGESGFTDPNPEKYAQEVAHDTGEVPQLNPFFAPTGAEVSHGVQH